MRRPRTPRSAVPGRGAVRLLLVAAPTLLALAGTAACNGIQGSTAAPDPSPSASTAATTPPSAPAGTTTPQARTTARAIRATTAIAACAPADVTPDLILQPRIGTATSPVALLQLTNKSAHTCRIYGWAGVALVNAAGENVPVPTRKVAQPGAPLAADLRPGETASAGIKWSVCDKGSADCPAGNTLTVTLPGRSTAVAANLSGFPAAEKSDITIKSLQIGSVQPSRQGVVAW